MILLFSQIDKWLDSELKIIDKKAKSGEIDKEEINYKKGLVRQEADSKKQRLSTSFTIFGWDKVWDTCSELNLFIIKYDEENGQLIINDKNISFIYGGKRPTLLKLLFKRPNRKWNTDEIAERLDKNDQIDNKYKNRFYALCDGINNQISNKTGNKLNNFLLFGKNYVRINPTYQLLCFPNR